MNTFIFVFLLGTPGVTAVLHTLRYFYTASSDVSNFPEFISVGYVDDVQIIHYDSNSRTAVPKQDWMKDITDQQFWERETRRAVEDQQRFKHNLENAKQRFNQTGGVHVYQRMYGCEWDDETGDVNGYCQDGYDGEDFLVLDLKSETWIAAKKQAFITKLKWDSNKAMMSYCKNYFTQYCPEWLKKYVNAGRSSLMRTDLPSIKLLQRTPSSPVTCHATGFYPRYAVMFWTKDQEEVLEGVNHGEMLPNHDGSFQMSVDLNISLIRAEDWSRYDCVFQLKGVEEDLTVTLDKSVILSNWRKSDGGDGGVVGVVDVVVGGLVVVLLLMAITGFFLWRESCPGVKKGFFGHSEEKKGKNPNIQQQVSEEIMTSEETTDSPLMNDDDVSVMSRSSVGSFSTVGNDTPLIKT
ncbi:major histocompatibility complex class I-related gene protein-like isoform X2 [Gouania willdenowi]|uniref:major histocompatibility complex class I-related gene protein-like isoform X2 n=1 Tax=Gouania willdenowi TaxID=441366 RepID=UPI001054A3F1|nr:major histocompatibility complex class I-related gene protein-like isoform X2 [Gouania willdenowi]